MTMAQGIVAHYPWTPYKPLEFVWWTVYPHAVVFYLLAAVQQSGDGG